MENGKTGNAVEARCGEVKIVSNANHVRVGIVSVDDRIAVSALTIVSRKNVFSHKKAQNTQKDFLNQLCAFLRLNFLFLPLPGPSAPARGDRASSRVRLRDFDREWRDRSSGASPLIPSNRAHVSLSCYALQTGSSRPCSSTPSVFDCLTQQRPFDESACRERET